MKKFAILFILGLSLAGCTTDDAADVPQGMLRKVHVIPFAADEAYSTRYYYEGHKLDRTESTNDTRQVYYYDGDLIVNIKTYQDAELTEEQQFQYDDSGRLTVMRQFDYPNDSHWKREYSYNADQTVTENSYWTSGDGVEYPHDQTQFFFTNGEVSQAIITSANGTATVVYTYDDKLVPEHGIIGLDKIRMFQPGIYKGIYHNIVSVTHTNSLNWEVGTYSHIWTYNADGAPTYFSYDDSGTITIDGGTVEYFYK